MAWPRQPKVVLKVSQVPDWGRRAIRLSIALVFFTTIAISLWPVPEYLREEWGDEVRQTCNWAGASCAVVAASPLIGKVAQLSYERTLGTLTGGLLGFMVYDYGVLVLPDLAADVLMVVAVAAVGALSCWLSFKFSLDASMRLFVITFLIVMFGGNTHSALGVALLRTGGIITGVLLFMGLTVVVLPKSATIEALREMKKGLKLLTELNTLVWTSKQEAEAALKAAADKARAAELAAANAASVATKSGSLASAFDVALSGPNSSSKSKWWSVSTTLAAMLGGARRSSGYQRLPDLDPEAGTAGPSTAGEAAAGSMWTSPMQSPLPHGAEGQPGWSADGWPGSTGVSNGHPVSYLTQALKEGGSSSRKSQAGSGADRQQVLVVHDSGQAQARAVSMKQFMDEYEERCEGVLTKVYQSMFKVKEHVQLADNEVYVYHFCGHYLFLPMFFNRALINWLLPKRWRLPAAALEDISTSVRIIARLLWTVHLDFSQEGFDEVIQALPAAAGMSNLLLELAACTSASLGVLVEAFPNKEAVLVDHLKALEVLINKMLEISGDEHEGLIKELAANRTKTARTHRADSAGGGLPQSPMHTTLTQRQHQQLLLQQQQQQQGEQLPLHVDRSPFSGLSQDLGSRPAAAAVAAVSGDGPERMASTLLAAARLGVDLHSPRTGQQLQQQQQQQGDSPRQEVWFVTYQDHEDEHSAVPAVAGVSHSMAVDGLGPPQPAESPDLLLSPAAPVTAASPTAGVPADAAAGPSQTDLMFDMADSFVGSPVAAGSVSAAAAASAAAPPALARHESHRSSGAVSSSLIRNSFKPMVRVPTLRLNRPAAHQQGAFGAAVGPLSSTDTPRSMPGGAGRQGAATPAAGGTSPHSPARRGTNNAAALALLRSTSAPDQAAADAAVALLQEYKQQEQEQKEQQQQEAKAVAAQEEEEQQRKQLLLQLPQQQQQQQQQTAEGGGAGGAAGTNSMSLMLQALDDPETMSFVKLTRWYSFQFLMMELLIELHDLYHRIREVLTTLPHGL